MKKLPAGLLIVLVLVLVLAGFWYLYAQRQAVESVPFQTVPVEAQPTTETPAIAAETIPGVAEQEEFSEVKYSYPRFSGLEDAAVEEKINADIKDTIVKAAENNKGQYADVCGAVDPSDPDGLQCRFTYDYEYKSFTQLSDRIFSVRLETYMYAGGAHGNTNVEFINYNLETGERLDWRSVFTKDSDYLGAIAKYANADIKKQLLTGEDSMSQADLIDEGSAATTENYADGNVGFDEQGLIVVFQPYQVAAYAQGAVISSVPYGELKGVIDENGLLKK